MTVSTTILSVRVCARLCYERQQPNNRTVCLRQRQWGGSTTGCATVTATGIEKPSAIKGRFDKIHQKYELQPNSQKPQQTHRAAAKQAATMTGWVGVSGFH